jgi:hypothetical protein
MNCEEKQRLTQELSEAIKELVEARSIFGDGLPLAVEVLAAERVFEEKLATLVSHIAKHGCGATEQ